jgi:hypothetical protein
MTDIVERLRWSGQDAMTKHLSMGMATLHAEAADEIERLTAAIKDAPILSKYHGHHGFEVERFITDYEAWKRRALETKP